MRQYVDTNVLYLFLRPPEEPHPHRAWLRDVMAGFAGGSDEAVISPLVLDELAYRLLLALLKDEGVSDPLGELRRNTAQVLERLAPRTSSLVQTVSSLPGLTIAPVDDVRLVAALRYKERISLLPRDALHVAVAVAEGCEGILSLDEDLARAAEEIPWLGPLPGE